MASLKMDRAWKAALPVLTPRLPPPLPPKSEMGDLTQSSLAELKEICRVYERPVSGTKAQLIARLYGEPVPPGRAPEVRPHVSSARTRGGLRVAARTEL
jgi:hypothetical protein